MASSKHHGDILSQIEKKGLPQCLKRSFIDCDDNNIKKDVPVIRIMQWNMLAQALCHGSDNFIRCPKPALDWENRKLRIIEEMLQYDPHIICLQEVDRFDFVQENLKKEGYAGMFFPKPSSPCLDFEHHTGPDGCAIFYDTNAINLIDKDNIILEDGHHRTNQVSIVGKFGFKLQTECPEFTVAVTHLKAKAPYSQLRLRQGSYLLKYLEDTVGKSPVIVCGDFNADPEEPIYSTFKESKLGLKSSSTCLSETKSEPKYTTWKIRGSPKGEEENCRTIDYIWYSKHFKPKTVLEIPEGERLGKDKLPSFTFPSDHLSLVCDFQLQC